MFIKHNTTSIISSSLLIDSNDFQFHIFFTDFSLTYFICKSAGHTSYTCKEENLTNMETSYHPQDSVNETEIKSTNKNTDIDQIKNTLPHINASTGRR